MSTTHWALVGVTALLFAAGCDNSSEDTDSGDSGGTEACAGCHGTGEQGAPPPDTTGSTDPTTAGVGAHAAHGIESTWRGEIHCRHCHVVPETVDDPGHMDDALPAEVVLGGLSAAFVDATYEADGCLVYCHGGALKGGPVISPPWTTPGELGCDACHANPPAAPHPAAADCNRCHIDILDDQQNIKDPLRHIDAILQAPHGAHIAHLGSIEGVDFPCTTCHQGVNYHAAMNDGEYLDDTEVCAACHGDDAATLKTQWHTYVPEGW